MPGPEEEIGVVRDIYRSFVLDRRSEREIADILNDRGLVTDLGRPWTRGAIHQVLINEKYIGNNVWNRVSFKLKKKRIRNEPAMWIRAEGVFTAIVEPGLFEAAQAIIRERAFRMSDEEMLKSLHALFQRQGMLSGLIIDEAEDMPSSSSFRSRFGSLLRAYGLVGYRPRRDYRYIEINRGLRRLHPGVVEEIIDGLRVAGAHVDGGAENDLLHVNDEFTISVVIVRCRRTPSGSLRWRVRFDTGLQPDITVTVRMDAANRKPIDYYLFPTIDRVSAAVRLADASARPSALPRRTAFRSTPIGSTPSTRCTSWPSDPSSRRQHDGSHPSPEDRTHTDRAHPCPQSADEEPAPAS
jgi:hypothetical protein